MAWLVDFPLALWAVLTELAPSLLLGLFLAGLIHVYVPTGWIHRGLSRPDRASVTRASLIGVPLPLCSCGVIPTALGLRRDGASSGATTSFLISTPQTGVDSVLVTAAFLGWPFALFKLVAAFGTGVVGGLIANRVDPHPGQPPEQTRGADGSVAGGPVEALRYAIFDLLATLDRWLIVGVLVAALIAVLVPPDFFAGRSWTTGLSGMLVMLAIALPLYVCTTASVPLAASLIAAGLPAGSAMVLLMAGPATNVATIGAVLRTLGAPLLAVYLGTVVVMSLGFGLLFDGLVSTVPAAAVGHAHGAGWFAHIAAIVLVGLLVMLEWRRRRERRTATGLPTAPVATDARDWNMSVGGMTCGHCVASVAKALEGVPGVVQAHVDLGAGRAAVRGREVDPATLRKAVEQVGFTVGSVDPAALSER